MHYQSTFGTLLATVALLAMAGIAVAGGNTVAASDQSQILANSSSRTLASGLSKGIGSGGTDVCATIINRSASAGLIELSVTDDNPTTTTLQIEKAKSSSLCAFDTESVSVSCLGPDKCVFKWSIDRF